MTRSSFWSYSSATEHDRDFDWERDNNYENSSPRRWGRTAFSRRLENIIPEGVLCIVPSYNLADILVEHNSTVQKPIHSGHTLPVYFGKGNKLYYKHYL